MNAEIDATIGPILQVYAAKYGVILSACDGDEPGVQMNLYRWVRGLGLIPRVIGNIKGLQDPYRNSDNAEGVRRKVGPESRDGHQFRRRLEDQLRTGDRRQRHRLRGEITRHVARQGIPRRRDDDRAALRHRRAQAAGRDCRLRGGHAAHEGVLPCRASGSRSSSTT